MCILITGTHRKSGARGDWEIGYNGVVAFADMGFPDSEKCMTFADNPEREQGRENLGLTMDETNQSYQECRIAVTFVTFLEIANVTSFVPMTALLKEIESIKDRVKY